MEAMGITMDMEVIVVMVDIVDITQILVAMGVDIVLIELPR
jgi:hypothetical protein